MLEKFKANHVWISDRRCYAIEDKVYPGVTTILSATRDEQSRFALEQWREEVGEIEAKRIVDHACRRGTVIHGLIEDYLVGVQNPCPLEFQGFWDSIRPALSNVTDIQLIEGAVWHPDGYAGSVDCVASWKGQLAIVDWKTSSKLKKSDWITEYKEQTAAYCAAVNRRYGTRINHSVIVIALEDRPAQVFEVEPKELIVHWRSFSERVRRYHERFPITHPQR